MFHHPFILEYLLKVPSQFLITFTISLMKALDIRSEGAVKLLAEFLDLDEDGSTYVSGNRHRNAEHFAHGKSNMVLLR